MPELPSTPDSARDQLSALRSWALTQWRAAEGDMVNQWRQVYDNLDYATRAFPAAA